jgi:outer membrane lipoprotein carrier protein
MMRALMKKMLTKSALGLMLCLLGSSAIASQKVDDKAELKQHIKQLATFAADFSQRVIDVDGKELMQGKGKVHLSHPSLIRWHALTPDENLMISDGDTLWIYNIDLEQVTAISAKEAIDSTPFALLSSSDDQLWSHYEVTKSDEAFVITPLKQSGQVKRLLIYFKRQQFSRLVIEDLSQQKSEFTFSNAQANQKLAKQLFTFSLPEGVELDDQRN